MSSNEFDHTVTCLSGDHLIHWQTISRAIVKNIDSKTFSVICPDDISDKVAKASDPEFIILKESELNQDLQHELRKKVISSANPDRYGWYLQQFLKLAFIQQHRDSEYILIWDSDTIPIRPINFKSPNGEPIFYHGDEFHAEYFRSIHRLTGLEKLVEKSFIAQCLPVDVRVILPYFDRWSATATEWYEPLFDSIDFSQQSGFSEYELVGTIFSHHSERPVQFSERKWIRNGTELFGDPANIPPKKVAEVDFVAFEIWQKSGFVARLRRSVLKVLALLGKMSQVNRFRLKGNGSKSKW